MAADRGWTALLARVRSGEADARAELVERFHQEVGDIVHRQLQSDFRRNKRWILPLFSTGDVVQEVLLGVVAEPLDGFTGATEAEFVQYLSAIVKHRLIDAVRYHEAARRDVRRQVAPDTAAHGQASPDARDPTPSLAAMVGEQLAAFEEVAATLNEKDQQLIRRRIIEEEPFAEVAAALGLPTADAARQAFHAAKARLLVRLRARGLGDER